MCCATLSRARFGERLKAINAGLERDGAFYLFTLRMIPQFPFFVVNLVMGLTRIRTWTFVWVSQVGMLLGTIAYVNAGTQLAQIETHLRTALAVAAGLVRASRHGAVDRQGDHRRDQTRVRSMPGSRGPKSFDRNLVVIGAGSAGLVSAYIAAR